MRMVLRLMVLATFCGCATPYQSKGLSGGFSEIQLDRNVFQVNFRGNGYTSFERAADFTLLRSAELTLQNGYSYFIIVERAERTSVSSYTTPTQSHTTASATAYGNTAYGQSTTTTTGGETYLIRKPSTSNTIVCFSERPKDVHGLVYDARFVSNSLTRKYGIPANYYPPEPEPRKPIPGEGAACKIEADCQVSLYCGRIDEGTRQGTCIPIGTR